MKTLVLFARLALLSSLMIVSRWVAPGEALGTARTSSLGPQKPPLGRYTERHKVKRPGNPAAGFGRSYSRTYRLRSRQKPDSLPARAQQWLASLSQR